MPKKPKKEDIEKPKEALEQEKTPEKEEPKINPRWDLINELYDAVDNSIVNLGNKNEMNFVEISMALHMINKKIEYEQFRAMFDFNIEGINEPNKTKSPDSMYRWSKWSQSHVDFVEDSQFQYQAISNTV